MQIKRCQSYIKEQLFFEKFKNRHKYQLEKKRIKYQLFLILFI